MWGLTNTQIIMVDVQYNDSNEVIQNYELFTQLKMKVAYTFMYE